jgi:hypothetical protein
MFCVSGSCTLRRARGCLQVEDFSEFGKGKKSAGQGIEGGTTYRELSPRAGPEKER